MAGGGEAPSVEPWDLSALVGAILLTSTILMLTWPPSHDVGLTGDRIGLTEVGVGALGSADSIEVTLRNATACEVENSTCTGAVIHVSSPNGDEITQFRLSDGESHTTDRMTNGPVTVEASGEGQYRITVKVHRQLPLEFVPAMLGIVLLAWGEWRRRQGPSP